MKNTNSKLDLKLLAMLDSSSWAKLVELSTKKDEQIFELLEKIKAGYSICYAYFIKTRNKTYYAQIDLLDSLAFGIITKYYFKLFDIENFFVNCPYSLCTDGKENEICFSSSEQELGDIKTKI